MGNQTTVSIPIPLTLGKWLVLVGEFPLTTHEWDRLGEVLGAMRSGLVLVETRPFEPDAPVAGEEAGT